ncbi:MAG: hypothetical protein ABIZ80_19030 [Bryobacteraceae bacterium]
MSTALEVSTAALEPVYPAVSPIVRLPPVPWRDPHTVSPAQLAEYIAMLEKACAENPKSPGLRTCLGMAHAMNYDVYRSMDALEEAVALDPSHFFAQLKYSELQYRIRALHNAERETKKALDLATNGWEMNLARKQLQEIRRLMRDGTQKPEWTKPLTSPAIVFILMTIVLCLAVMLQ